MSMFGGGAFGGGFGHGGTASGLPFAGIPEEMRAGVEELLEHEPDHGEPEADFSQRSGDLRPISIRQMFGEHRRAVARVGMLVVVSVLTVQSGPFLAQIGIDHGIVPRRASVVVASGLAYIVAVLAGTLAERARVRATGRLAASVMRELRVRVFAHLQRLSLDYFTEEKAGVIMTRMTSDIETLQQLVQDGFAQFAIQGLTMLVVMAVLFSYNVELALITIGLVVPALTALSWWFAGASERTYLEVRDGIAGVLSHLSESLAGVRVVALYNRRHHNVIEHRNVVGDYRLANDKSAHVNALYGAGSDGIGLLGQMALLLIGGEMVVHHRLSVGELLAFILYLGSFFQPIQQLVMQYGTYQQGQAAVTKLRSLLATEPSVVEAPGAAALPPIRGEIGFRDVSFAYNEGEPVLTHVELTIAPGETVAFVGPTGAGKSTIAKLVPRFYDPSSGTVTIDGIDLRSVTIGSLRSQLGVVPQEPYLFSGTMRENVAFSRPDAPPGEVAEAVALVGLQDLVDRLPDGLDTPVHERGQSLSSGERQLVALARAFLARPRVLVLDEATSNLDLQSESKVEAALDLLLEGRTAILIAHRLSTAMRADRIVVVDDGRIAEVGSHEELLAAGGRYAGMYATWTGQGDAAEVA